MEVKTTPTQIIITLDKTRDGILFRQLKPNPEVILQDMAKKAGLFDILSDTLKDVVGVPSGAGGMPSPKPMVSAEPVQDKPVSAEDINRKLDKLF